MIYFGIPLRSKYSSNDWGMVSMLFNRTLWSVYNQSNPDFRIIVACHEKPSLYKSYDSRVEFIQVDVPFPKDLHEQMCDKGYKVHTIGKRIRELGGGFTMIVDADDLVSKNLVRFVADHPDNRNGWYVKTGYILYLDKKRLNVAPKFPSGTNTIIHYTPDQLPPDMEDAWKPSDDSRPYIIIKGHSLKTKLEACARVAKPLTPLPFRAAVYVLGTGDNHSTLSGYRSQLRNLLDLTLTRTRISDKFKNEFSLEW